MVTPNPSPSPFRLDGCRALVTGGGSGLGFTMASALADAGASLVLVGRNAERLKDAAIRIKGAEFLTADVMDAHSDVIGLCEERWGPVDVLINNAGVQHREPAMDVGPDDWARIIDTNLSAPFRLMRRAAQTMAKRGGGKIINTLSVLADLGRPTVVPYSAAKGGLKTLTRALAVEWGPLNIQVNGIAPGYFATEMNAALTQDRHFCGWLEARTPMRRWGRPEEIGPAAVFLAAPASDFVTGHVIVVDGGLTAAV